jgi:mannosyltransferase
MSHPSKRPNLNQWSILIGLILLGAALRLPFLETQSIAFDESFSLAVSSADWGLLFQAILSDGVHPPLFYGLHKLNLAVMGHSEFGQRFMMAAFSLLGLPAIYQAGKRLFNPTVGSMAMLLLALNPLHIWFSQEARMYSLLSMLVTLSMVFFWEAINHHQRRTWITLGVINALIYLIHYFGLLVPVIQCGYLMLTFKYNHKRLRAWTVSQIGAGVVLVPWLVATFLRPVQSFGIGFLVRPALLDLPLTFWNLTTGINDYGVSALLTLIFFGAAFIAALFIRAPGTRPPGSRPHLLLVCWGVVPILLIWIISQRRSFYADRYFSFCIPALLLLAAYGLFQLASPAQRRIVGVGLVAATLTGLIAMFMLPTYQKDQWRLAADYIAHHEQPADVVLLRSLHIKYAFDYYYEGRAESVPATVNLTEYNVEELTSGAARAWLVFPYTRRPTHYPMQPLTDESVWDLEQDEPARLKAWFEAHQANIVDSQRFLGIQLWLVDLKS